MTDHIEFNRNTKGIRNDYNVGSSGLTGKNVGSGKCPYCRNQAAFTQVGRGSKSDVHGDMVPLECDGCNSIFAAAINKRLIFPNPDVEGVSDLSGEIDGYYKEAVRCLEAEAPNGAVAILRKIIEAVCSEYGVTDVDDDSIYDMINELANEGHITDELRESLLAVKDAGNDAVHLNQNDPSLEQADNLRRIVDSVLTATVMARERAEQAREDHPNPYSEE